MPSLNPAVKQWIRQMGDRDQVVAYFAYQSLKEEVFHASRPGNEAALEELSAALGEALIAQAKPGQGARGAASFRNNVFLASAATRQSEPLHGTRVRNNLARLLGYIPTARSVSYLSQALADLEVRETARQSLECDPSERATTALIAALETAGPVFCAGVINSLAKRKGDAVLPALRKAAVDPQPEIRIAAMQALADVPEPVNDAILERATKAADPGERGIAHAARARLAEALREAGNKPASEQLYRAILAGDAPEPQKRAGRLALGIK